MDWDGAALRRLWRERRDATIVAGLVAASALLAAIAIVGHELNMTASVAPASATTAAAPIPSEEPKVEAKTDTRMPSRPDPRASLEPYSVSPPYRVDDGLTFGPERAMRTRLDGLEGPSRDAVCLDRDGRLWACGLQARAALNNAIRNRRLTCEPVRTAEQIVLSRCQADGDDVGRALVKQGFARPAGRDETPETKSARTSGRGLWNGGWRIKT